MKTLDGYETNIGDTVYYVTKTRIQYFTVDETTPISECYYKKRNAMAQIQYNIEDAVISGKYDKAIFGKNHSIKKPKCNSDNMILYIRYLFFL